MQSGGYRVMSAGCRVYRPDDRLWAVPIACSESVFEMLNALIWFRVWGLEFGFRV